MDSAAFLFKDLAEYALTCLVALVSNALVEIIFFLLTAVKTKPRNRMETQLLKAIIIIRTDMLLRATVEKIRLYWRTCCSDSWLILSTNRQPAPA